MSWHKPVLLQSSLPITIFPRCLTKLLYDWKMHFQFCQNLAKRVWLVSFQTLPHNLLGPKGGAGGSEGQARLAVSGCFIDAREESRQPFPSPGRVSHIDSTSNDMDPK